jgi:hypothetical protein
MGQRCGPASRRDDCHENSLLGEAARDSSLVLAYRVKGLGHIERGRGDYRFS